jgi:SAM-dependent methyltransferase
MMKYKDDRVGWYEASLPVGERKKRGHFSTPPKLVEHILDACGYAPEKDLTHIRVLDPACGSGNFLAEATRRLLIFAQQQGLSQKEQIALIQRNIWGFDPDPISCFLAEMQLRAITPISFHIHQADGLTLPWEPCIDLFVTNPPYLAAKNNDLSAYQLAQQRGQTDSYLLFLDVAFQVVRPNGWIGIVLPDPVLARANAAKQRLHLLEAFTLHHLWHLAGVFAAEVGAVVLIAQKRPPQLTHQVFWIRERWRNVGAQFIALETTHINDAINTTHNASAIPQSLFLRQPAAELRYLLASEHGKIIQRLHSYLHETPIENRRIAPLEEFLLIRRGEELGRESPYLAEGLVPATNRCRSVYGRGDPGGRPGSTGDYKRSPLQDELPDWYPVLRGGVDVRPYSTPTTKWWIAQQAIKKPLERYLSPKLLAVKSTDCLQAALDMQGHIALQTLYLLHLRNKDMLEDLYFFLALLNSRLLRQYVYTLHTAYKWVQPQIEQSVLARLPIPIVEQNVRQDIISLAKALSIACSGNTSVVEWSETITTMYEELEHAIRALYDSIM